MNNYEEKIDNIRNYFNDHKAERYPLINTILAEKDEYTKSLYFRMLCMLVRYTKEPNDMQILYIKRLIAGTQAENTFQNYMKMAIEIETKDVEEFISIFSKDELRYYFCIDGAILLNVAPNDKDYKLFAEIIEILGVTKKELNYLMEVARSICLQDSEAFNDAKELSVDSLKTLDVYHYIEGFYSGDIVNTPTLLHITSYNKTELDLSQYGEFSSQKVIIENIQYCVLKTLVFKGCAEVIIRNCKFIGDISRIEFLNIGKVTIENSEFSNFKMRVAYFSNVNEIYCSYNKFINCGYEKSSYIKGGIFYSCGDGTNSVMLKNNMLLNCYTTICSYSLGYRYTAIFMNVESRKLNTISVIDNCFNGCECRERGNIEAYVSCYSGTKEENNNICTGSVTRIFE